MQFRGGGRVLKKLELEGLSGYSIQVSLYRTPDNFLRTSPVTKYTAACQYAPHDITRFYILIQFYTRSHFLREPVTHARYTAICQHTPQDIMCFYTILRFYIRRTFLCQPVIRARKYRPLQNTFPTHMQVRTFPLSLL